MINKFEGRWGFLSNFYPCQIEHKGITYPSLEHYYVSLKITEMQFIDGYYYTASDLREIISKIPSPGEVKKIGRKLKVRTDWDDKKLDFMKHFQSPINIGYTMIINLEITNLKQKTKIL
jgi:predicted NAD-dependent protein-ADP-ribosyltransferase YbiA (DUF1768 family)